MFGSVLRSLGRIYFASRKDKRISLDAKANRIGYFCRSLRGNSCLPNKANVEEQARFEETVSLYFSGKVRIREKCDATPNNEGAICRRVQY